MIAIASCTERLHAPLAAAGSWADRSSNRRSVSLSRTLLTDVQSLEREQTLQRGAVEVCARVPSKPRLTAHGEPRCADQHQVRAPHASARQQTNRARPDGVRGRFAVRKFVCKHVVNLPGSRVWYANVAYRFRVERLAVRRQMSEFASLSSVFGWIVLDAFG